jgi:hypothetical protein
MALQDLHDLLWDFPRREHELGPVVLEVLRDRSFDTLSGWVRSSLRMPPNFMDEA